MYLVNVNDVTYTHIKLRINEELYAQLHNNRDYQLVHRAPLYDE